MKKKYNNIAFVLQGILSKLFIVNGNIKAISHISKTKQNAIKFFSGMLLVLSLAKKTISNINSRMTLIDNKLRLIIFSKLFQSCLFSYGLLLLIPKTYS